MSEKIEGTLVLDGLIEGRSADLAAIEPSLREWRAFVEKVGLPFSLEIEGNSFNLLGADRPVEVRRLSGNPGDVVTDALNQLLRVFPPEERRAVFSTVRSLEYRKGVEVQTLYVVGPDGVVTSRERTVEARTVAPDVPITWRRRLVLAAAGLAVAALVFAISAIFVDYHALWNRFVEGLWPTDVRTLAVETGRFERFFVVTDRKALSGGRGVVLTLRRTAAFPRTDADCEKLAREPDATLMARLTVEAIARGRIGIECYDRDDRLVSFTPVVIRELRTREALDVEIVFPSDRRVRRMLLTE